MLLLPLILSRFKIFYKNCISSKNVVFVLNDFIVLEASLCFRFGTFLILGVIKFVFLRFYLFHLIISKMADVLVACPGTN